MKALVGFRDPHGGLGVVGVGEASVGNGVSVCGLRGQMLLLWMWAAGQWGLLAEMGVGVQLRVPVGMEVAHTHGAMGLVVVWALLVVWLVRMLLLEMWRVVVIDPGGHGGSPVLLHVRWEEHANVPCSPLLQHVQGGHFRSGQAVALQILRRWKRLPKAQQVGMVGVTVSAPETSPEAMQQQVGLHTLHLLRLFLATWSVLVVRVVLHVLKPQTLGLLHEGPLVQRAKSLPGLAQHLAEHGVVQVWVLQGQTFALILCPHHERVHGSPDSRFRPPCGRHHAAFALCPRAE